MNLVSAERVVSRISSFHFPRSCIRPSFILPLPICSCRSACCPTSPLATHARKRDADVQPLLKKKTVKEQEAQVEEEADKEPEEADGEEVYEGVEKERIEDFGDEILVDDTQEFEEDFNDDDEDLYVGDGGGGGGISLAGTWCDKEALAIAEEVSMSFDGDLKIYAFKTLANSTIRVRIEKVSSKYGSPSMSEIEAFSSAYRARLDEAEVAGSIPENISLEVSSPGVERVVRIPEELERFKDKPMYVRYAVNDPAAASPQENDGVLRLISFDVESCRCTWGIADVRINREQTGKGRPLSKKQREWRLETPFYSLRLVRVYSDC